MKVEITISSYSAAVVVGILRELLTKGDSLTYGKSRHIEAVIAALDEADRIVICTASRDTKP